MRSFKIDPTTGDIVLDGQNNIVMVGEDDDILQCIERIITTNLGEWFLNPLLGFDRYEILGKKYNRDYATELIYSAILQEDRVESIESIDFEFGRQNRRLDIKMELIKVNGERLEGEVNANGIRI